MRQNDSLRCRGFWLFTALLSLGVCVTLLSACSGVTSREDYQIPLAEKQISEMEKKIDELHHRVSMMQFMIDNHERSIISLEKTSSKIVNIEKPSSEIVNIEKPSSEIVNIEKPSSEIVNIEKPSSEKQQSDAIVPDAPAGAAAIVPIESPDKETPPPAPAVPYVQPDFSDFPKEDLSGHPEMLYNSALAAYKKMDYNTAVSEFTAFAEKYPEHELADNALYWIGECLYAQKKFSEAVAAFEAVTTRYPEGSKVPDALLKTGYAYLALDDKDNARLFLKKVIRNFPFSQAGSKAEGMLKRLN